MKIVRFATPVLALALIGTTGAALAQQGYGPPRGGYGQGGPGGPGGGWDAPPNEFREYSRIGFREGIDGAHKDMENHRRPNVNNRDEFRHPHVPREVRDDYRGYDAAWSHGGGFGPPPPRPY